MQREPLRLFGAAFGCVAFATGIACGGRLVGNESDSPSVLDAANGDGDERRDAGLADDGALAAPDDANGDASVYDARPVPDAMGADSSADAASDADHDAPDTSRCAPDDPVPPTAPSTSTISFQLVNSSTSDRFVLTQATECEAYSFEAGGTMPLVTLIPDECPCGPCGLPPETLYFQRLLPGATTTVSWDARALAMYYSYEDCRPSGQFCSSRPHGSPHPVSPGSYFAEFVVSDTVPTGPGANCSLVAGGDVTCTIRAQMQTGGQCDPINIGLRTTFVRQPFIVPAIGNATVQVTIQ